MAKYVCSTAMLKCSFGTAPSSLTVLPTNKVMGKGGPMASIMDHKPFVNIKPFGQCSSISNPMVLTATIAALGVLTPMPCIPATVAPWAPGAPTVKMKDGPALNDSSKCMCIWGGAIQVTQPGQQTVKVP